ALAAVPGGQVVEVLDVGVGHRALAGQEDHDGELALLRGQRPVLAVEGLEGEVLDGARRGRRPHRAGGGGGGRRGGGARPERRRFMVTISPRGAVLWIIPRGWREGYGPFSGTS